MATPAISPAPAVDPAAFASARLRLDDLLRVLLTELTHQDPFKPVDNKDFMAQIAQFAALNSTDQVNQGVQQLLALQALNQTVGLIGREVTAQLDGGPVTGRVIAVTLVDGAPRLTLSANGAAIPNIAIGQLQTIRPAGAQ